MWRILLLALFFSLEVVGFTTWLDTGALKRSAGLTGLMGDWAPPVLRSLIIAAAVFATFAYLNAGRVLQRISLEIEGTPVARRSLGWHAASLLAFAGISLLLFRDRFSDVRSDWIAALWLALGVAIVVSAAFAFVPPAKWLELLRGAGAVWAYALAAGVLAYPLAKLTDRLWTPSANLTLRLVELCLRPFVHGLVADAATRVVGTQAFRVSISPQCSGLEGAGLMLIFGVLWLWLFRDECRFPQALALLPAGVAVLWSLNVVRIAALILIGNAGAPQVALGGFHSQAGWIAFNAVGIGLTLVFPHLRWMSKRAEEAPRVAVRAENPGPAYLVPFLAILAAAMISHAASSGFEWLYPLRFAAAGAALWFYRAQYVRMDWKCGWFALSVGVAVFGLWLALDGASGPRPGNTIGSSLSALAPGARVAWLLMRTLAAVSTVPIAEELAFRGFLTRRILSADFESIGLRTFHPLAVLASSLAFGVLHGDRWLAGTFAGFLYSIALARRGRIGDAVAAHATTNVLLAAWVLVSGNWSLW